MAELRARPLARATPRPHATLKWLTRRAREVIDDIRAARRFSRPGDRFRDRENFAPAWKYARSRNRGSIRDARNSKTVNVARSAAEIANTTPALRAVRGMRERVLLSLNWITDPERRRYSTFGDWKN